MPARGCVDEGLSFRVMRCWSGRDDDDIFEDFVKMSGKVMPAWVNIDGGVESFDVKGLLYAPFFPIILRSQDYVFFPKSGGCFRERAEA